MSHQRARGFSLLEAIVAMALLGSAGLMLFAWIQSNLQTAQRLRDAEARARLQIEAQGWIGKLNPMLRPEGEERLGALRVRWSGRLVEPAMSEFHYGEAVPTRWRVGLYELAVEAEQGDTRTRWTQRVAGWQAASAAGGR